MNKNITPQRTPNGRRTPQRNNRPSKYSTAFTVILLTTAVLLVVSIITLSAVAIIGAFDKDTDEPYDDGGKEQNEEQSEEQAENNTVVVDKKNYLSSSAQDAEQIEGISSQAAILVAMDGNLSIAEKNADVKVYPASMTKVMTLLVACEQLKDTKTRLTVTQEMVDYQKSHGASGNLNFVAGESISAQDALYLVNYRSDTIACLLLAEHISGSEAEFVKLMNERARDIGLTKTNFTNSTGLHDENHYTTCREMAAIVNCAMNNAKARSIFTSYKERTVNVYQGEEILRNPPIYASWYRVRLGDNNWAGGGSDMLFIGGKTGNETIPSSCFATVATDTETEKNYICVTVGRLMQDGERVTDKQSTEDAKIIYKNYAEGR